VEARILKKQLIIIVIEILFIWVGLGRCDEGNNVDVSNFNDY
jgi:hypothetical protein